MTAPAAGHQHPGQPHPDQPHPDQPHAGQSHPDQSHPAQTHTDRKRRVHAEVLTWYSENGRDLPWRHPDCSPWGIFVSEVMAQQTPIARIIEPWRVWLSRWPTPSDLAAAAPAEAIIAWARLGFPRRALNLHAAAAAMVERHGGQVPADPSQLRALPGVGDYTAAAVSSFAFGIPEAVLDANVRRVLARLDDGQGQAPPSVTTGERARAKSWLPADRDDANTWNVAVMELGALVCSARSPACARCPVRASCRWLEADRPAYVGKRRPPQGYVGTDRERRGQLLAVLRTANRPLTRHTLLAGLPDDERARRCLDSLTADGLLVLRDGSYDLPRR